MGWFAGGKPGGVSLSSGMRIAVLADTHDRYPPGLPARFAGADEIWHLGDVCDPAVLAGFEQPGRPVIVVRGNCDVHEGWPLDLTLRRAGAVFHLTHIPPEKRVRGADVILHGHTHLPRDELRDGVRWLNPGCITRPRGAGASFAWLTLEPGRPPAWKIMPLGPGLA